MKLFKLGFGADAAALFAKIGVDKAGFGIMQKKAKHHLFYIEALNIKAANILKQDALSIGAELAVSRAVAGMNTEFTDALLIVNGKQLELLAKKESIQPFGLGEIGQKLKEFAAAEIKRKIELMGVLNINSDSFVEGSRTGAEGVAGRCESLLEQGADIIDIGAVSSRPGSVYVAADEEFARAKPVIDEIYAQKLYEKAAFSLDSFAPNVISYALERGFSVVNDINGCEDIEVAKLAAKYDARYVIMHKKGTPQTMQERPEYENVICEVEEFFKERIQRAEKVGVKKIVLDVGIGFGKNLTHNLLLLKHLSHFLHLGFPLMVGASRKSMIDAIFASKTEDRLSGSLALHLKALDEGASIIRAHDVYEHTQAIAVWQALRETTT